MANEEGPTIYKPLPKQYDALLRTEFEILAGGSRGGGKTETQMAWMLMDDYQLHPRFVGLMLRRNADDLRDWISRARRFYACMGGEVMGNPPDVRFPSGAVIRTGHLKDENAYEKYLGWEIHRLGTEELTLIPQEENYLKVLASVRSSIPELRPQAFSTTNPGGPGHRWVKRRWQLSGAPQKPVLTPTGDGRNRVYMPFGIRDNPYLMENDPAYVKMLEGLPDGLRQAWLEGSWDDYDIKGAYYTLEIAQAQHEGRFSETVKALPGLKVHVVFDLGIGDDMALGFFQRGPDGHVRMVDFYSNSGYGLPHYIALMQLWQRERGYVYPISTDGKKTYIRAYAPHDIRQRELTTGKMRVQLARELGVDFIVVPSVPVDDGIAQVRLLFGRLYTNTVRCEQAVEAWRNYRRKWDETAGIFLPRPVHDWTSHPSDLLRYAALVEDHMTNENDTVPSFEDQPKHETFSDYEEGEEDHEVNPLLQGVDLGTMGHGPARRE